jgi:hypothetical protein
VKQLPPRTSVAAEPAYLADNAEELSLEQGVERAGYRMAIESRAERRRLAQASGARVARAASGPTPAGEAGLPLPAGAGEPTLAAEPMMADEPEGIPLDEGAMYAPVHVGPSWGHAGHHGLPPHGCDILEPDCALYEPGCAAPEACNCGEPTCGICDPACGLAEPACGLVGPGCGLADSCDGCGDVVCGSCVGLPGPDYWCFPVCLPRFKELQLWAGVHGFKGPRDSPLFGGASDGNFGFQEGVNLGGRLPLVGLVFPQLSYQLGYQAVQSRLSGTSDPSPNGTSSDRSQNFITAGIFRRVPTGVQWGVVWDSMYDDLVMEESFHQIRYEASLKSPLGREFGFTGASHGNGRAVGGVEYRTVDQYLFFYRWHFWHGGDGRLWGGFTDDSEGLFGGEFQVPLNARWSLQTGFNYLITDQSAGRIGATEESWNLGMNLVWHLGSTAKQLRNNPHRPLFQVADNGWMFIDQKP